MAEFESLASAEPLDRHLQRHRTDRLIMLSDGIFAIATTLAALEIRLPEHPASLAGMLEQSGQSLVAYGLSFFVTAIFWIANRELFARVERTDNILTGLTLAMLCGIAILPAAVHVFYQPGGLTVGFKFYGLVMVVCGVMNSAMWVYAAARPHVMRREVPAIERWGRAAATLILPTMFAFALVLEKDQMFWVLPPVAAAVFLIRRVIAPRYWAAKAVDSAA